jgi:hypothetical protein
MSSEELEAIIDINSPEYENSDDLPVEHYRVDYSQVFYIISPLPEGTIEYYFPKIFIS